MKPTLDYTLYLVTDRDLMTAATVEESVEQAILGGATLVQLREKTLSSRAFYETALRVKAVTERYKIPLLINDRADIALAVGAAGVHLGQDDLPASAARRLLGPDAVIGVTAKTAEQARNAQRDGADYLGIGAMYATSTKSEAAVTTPEALREILSAVTLPTVAIGGIKADNAAYIASLGVDGLAVVSGIVAMPDIRAAAAAFRAEIMKGRAAE